VHAFLGAGDVTLAQVLRLTPLSGARSACGGRLLATELPASDAGRTIAALTSERAFPGGPAARRPDGGRHALRDLPGRHPACVGRLSDRVGRRPLPRA
jgi:hypothetical protein